ncbi:MAG: hypothetical protein COY42_18750 [Armatimonadetes bacterium CG_4_10_14_0_8_um_filter_66_14]|nr:MAG: hypothetical protein COY42_18750 [Armatimonadetes bacterium CG_4_10_14_0_8_um_filter_66_14]
MVITKLYVKTSANQAFVRTGSGGSKVVLDGGCLVVPIIHRVVPVSLETMKLDVDRRDQEALITKDNLRVDVTGEFYIKVEPARDDILAAARSLGEKSINPANVSQLVFEKLVSAIRSVAATMDLVDLHMRRDDFATAVFDSVQNELKPNGLTLETVTISQLDQTDPSMLSDENIFDAQGKKKITEITAAAKVERNRLERMAEQETTKQDVETRQRVLDLEKAQKEAEATQAAEVANIQAGKQREKQAYQIEQDRAVLEAEIAKDQQVKERQIAQEQSVEVASIQRDKALILQRQEKEQTDIAREQAVQSSEIAKAQAVEVAERQKQIAVAERDAERARAEEEALKAQAARESANQQVITVTAVAEADRHAQTKLIEAKQVIEQQKIKDQTEADVLAYTAVKEAEGDQEAAQRKADAQLTLAQAAAESKKRESEGDKAIKMVDVEVERERVNVEQARVEVERQSLENTQTFDRAGIELQKIKLTIEAQKEVQIALANNIGQFMSRGQYTVYGDPDTMASMMERFMKGLSIGTFADGLIAGASEDAKDAVRGLAQTLGGPVGAAVEKLVGSDTPDEPAPSAPADAEPATAEA